MWNRKTIEWIDVELTSFCNIACPGCLRQEKKKQVESILNKNIIEFEDLKRWITSKEFPNLKLLNFCGSVDEPTLHPDILDIVKHFKSFTENWDKYYGNVELIFNVKEVYYKLLVVN